MKKLAAVSYFVDFDLIGVLQIVSGAYLISGVLRIRSYFKKNESDLAINTRMLLLHSAAFGLYLFGALAYYGTYTLCYLHTTEGTLSLYYEVALVCKFVNLIALSLLCVILWNLGDPSQNELRASLLSSNSSGSQKVVVAEFDDEAEIQARIWN
jgi:hypothetical protein